MDFISFDSKCNDLPFNSFVAVTVGLRDMT